MVQAQTSLTCHHELFILFIYFLFSLLLPRRWSRDLRVHAPKFTKPKDEGWFVVLGNAESGELLALKRVPPVRGSSTYLLSFRTPDIPGSAVLTLYVMSDSYLGLDQQYDIPLKIIEASLEAQVNTEVVIDELDEEMEKWLPPPSGNWKIR
nr:activating signal cointegrator 1 complex subunit 3-like isoform X1 [Cherax quadricarinatus]